MHAGERHRLGEIREERGDVAIENAGEILADAQAYGAVVTVARDEDDDRDIAVELVGADEHAHARPLFQRHDRQREGEQQVFVDLE